MSGAGINVLLDIWAAHSLKLGVELSFLKHKDMYKTIDSIPLVNIPWESFSLYYQGEHPEDEHPPAWMDTKYDVWFRDPRRFLHDLITNPDFQEEFNYFPYHDYIDSKHVFQDFMSGDWAWKQAVCTLFFLYMSVKLKFEVG